MSKTDIERDIAKAQHIRKQYLKREDNKIEQLKRLDDKVKAPGKIAASTIGVIGSLTMGAGMALIMVENDMSNGLVLGIPGMIVALLAYPVYLLITGRRKKKYAAEVLNLSEELAHS